MPADCWPFLLWECYSTAFFTKNPSQHFMPEIKPFSSVRKSTSSILKGRFEFSESKCCVWDEGVPLFQSSWGEHLLIIPHYM